MSNVLYPITKLLLATTILATCTPHVAAQRRFDRVENTRPFYSEGGLHTTPLPMVAAGLPEGRAVPAVVVREGYRSVQVNVDAWGQNIVGDASNEPSITVDPNDPQRMAIGWRQFNAPTLSDLREAGVAFSRDSGKTWTFPGCLAPGEFGSDPVLVSDDDGTFYYFSVFVEGASPTAVRIFKSENGGATWFGPDPIVPGFFDKPWVAVDRTHGIGHGNIYVMWQGGPGGFMHSEDGAKTFAFLPVGSRLGAVGTIAVGPDGEVYVVGPSPGFLRSLDAMQPGPDVNFDLARPLYYFDNIVSCQLMGSGFPNEGLISQPWIATDHSDGPSRGNVYFLSFAECIFREPWQLLRSIIFRRSTDRGETWSVPVRINDDPPIEDIFAWFPMMSVAPNGRIDVVWNDTRNSPLNDLQLPEFSELYYSYSTDAGVTWSPNEPVSPPFNHFVGLPGGSRKLGDYYTMVSDNLGVNVAYAATFNGEQDIWFLRIGPHDCNGNDIPDLDDITNGTSMNCNGNDIPDECEYAPDATGDGRVNLADFAAMQNCFTGTRPTAQAQLTGVDLCCLRLDSNSDGAVDATDYATFDEAFMK